MGKRWSKSGIVRESPPFTHAKSMKHAPSRAPLHHHPKKHPLTNERVSHHAILNIQKSADFFFIKQIADKEGAEFAVAGADFIEAHFVDEFLELKNIVSE